MTTTGTASVVQEMQRIEQLVAEIEASADPAVLAAARDMVRIVLDLHGSGLAKLLRRIGESRCGRGLLDQCTGDELISSLLLLHGLHPDDLDTRVQQALDNVRPYLRSHGGNVELVSVSGGIVRLKMQGSCHGCPSSRVTLKLTIEQAIYDAAPDVAAIEVDGLDDDPAGLVQLDSGSRMEQKPARCG